MRVQMIRGSLCVRCDERLFGLLWIVPTYVIPYYMPTSLSVSQGLSFRLCCGFHFHTYISLSLPVREHRDCMVGIM